MRCTLLEVSFEKQRRPSGMFRGRLLCTTGLFGTGLNYQQLSESVLNPFVVPNLTDVDVDVGPARNPSSWQSLTQLSFFFKKADVHRLCSSVAFLLLDALRRTECDAVRLSNDGSKLIFLAVLNLPLSSQNLPDISSRKNGLASNG